MTAVLRSDDHGFVELDRAECFSLLGSVPVGRLVHTHRALPTIRPVNFLLLPDGVYLRTSPDGSIRRAAQEGAVVAFDQKSLAISGRDIMKAGVPQGPLVGRVLARLLDRVIDDPALNVPESLLGLLPEIIEEEST